VPPLSLPEAQHAQCCTRHMGQNDGERDVAGLAPSSAWKKAHRLIGMANCDTSEM